MQSADAEGDPLRVFPLSMTTPPPGTVGIPLSLMWKLRYREKFVPETRASRPKKEASVFFLTAPHTARPGIPPRVLSITCPSAEWVSSSRTEGTVLSKGHPVLPGLQP